MGNICSNYLVASGTRQQLEKLEAEIRDKTAVDDCDYASENNLEMRFDSSSKFPKDIFRGITDGMPDTDGLYIRVASDECAMEYLEQSIFRDGKWNFESETRAFLKHYLTSMPYYTTGAYVERISYKDGFGKTVFGWIVTGFEDDTFHNGEAINTEVRAESLDGLTPPNEEVIEE